ncbi:unnamed protein product (macronuclear) [Paramecium tetraurelia]|uniref:Uncharacterized protein n=1 Tax=Paramecium tetraurelia TaxID=5888 RepID=A0CQG9_PARTE|nr:uncharacterized protein GSPATT00009384001 [Paramecium tetraurelia]CAK73036.1 unnamed protein product [Paramecium tetraurelia]|eukprot:XP_001440433.1 hypothetical protein (macronuclear) [Paramecium tetraurelia strain d4-2]
MNSSNLLRIPKPQITIKQSEWNKQLERCRLNAQNPMSKSFFMTQSMFESQQISLHIQSQA